jgi:hypothetical protein
MNNVTRRNLLAGTAGAAGAVVLSFETPVKAATPPAGKQAPGWYRYKVGSVEVTVAPMASPASRWPKITSPTSNWTP